MVYLYLRLIQGWVNLGFSTLLPLVKGFNLRLERRQFRENMLKTWFKS